MAWMAITIDGSTGLIWMPSKTTMDMTVYAQTLKQGFFQHSVGADKKVIYTPLTRVFIQDNAPCHGFMTATMEECKKKKKFTELCEEVKNLFATEGVNIPGWPPSRTCGPT